MAEYLQDNLRVFVVPVDIFNVPDLSSNEKLTYIALRSFANPHSPTAFPSYKTLATMCSYSRQTAINMVKSLTEKGLISKEARYNRKKNGQWVQTSNIYTLETPNQVVKSFDHPQSNSFTTPVKSFDHPSQTVLPEHNHLTKPINNRNEYNIGEFPFYNWLEENDK